MSGIYRSEELLSRGYRRSDLTRLMEAGSLVAVRRGIYADTTASPYAVLALRAGARLGCFDAAAAHGLWTPPYSGSHVYAPRGVRPGKGFVWHRLRNEAWPERDLVASPWESVRHVARYHHRLDALMVLESALNLRVFRRSEVADLVRGVPERTRQFLGRARSDAQSGTETRVRSWFESRRVPVRSQVSIDGVGRVDLLVGERLVIELDSKAHHTAATDYADDRRRDLLLHSVGYLVIRLTYEQVFFDWQRTSQMLSGMLAERVHRRRRASSCHT